MYTFYHFQNSFLLFTLLLLLFCFFSLTYYSQLIISSVSSLLFHYFIVFLFVLALCCCMPQRALKLTPRIPPHQHLHTIETDRRVSVGLHTDLDAGNTCSWSGQHFHLTTLLTCLLAALLVKLGSAAETSNNPGIVLWILGLQTTGTILLDVSGVGAKTKVLKLCSVMMQWNGEDIVSRQQGQLVSHFKRSHTTTMVVVYHAC